jgi:competence protein ComFC
VIRKFKFEGYQQLAHPLARLLKACLEKDDLGADFDWLAPVPVHPKRRKERGFDHILLLASALSKQTGVPVFTGLRRMRNTAPQFGLDFGRRQENVRGAFRLDRAIPLRSGRVILLDDVLTTGATVSEIGQVLKGGAPDAAVTVLSVARVSLLYSSL